MKNSSSRSKHHDGLIRRSSEDDLTELANLLMIGEVAMGYFGSQMPVSNIEEELDQNLALSRVGRGVVWVTLNTADKPSIIAYAAVSSGRLSYCVAPEFWRNGVATRLLKVVTADVFSTWPDTNLRATVIRENVASARLLEKSGFRFVGLQRQRASRVMLRYELVGSRSRWSPSNNLEFRSLST